MSKRRPSTAGREPIRVRSSTERLSDRVARELEQRILTGEYQPGDYLPTEAELCEMFDVSRSVIRDANRTLAARDLVDPRPGLGNLVLPPSNDSLSRAVLGGLARSGLSLRDAMEGRALIEESIVPLAAKRSTADQRAEVSEAFDQFAKAVADEDWGGAHRADLAFHQALLRAANQPALDLMLSPLQLVIFVCAAAAVPDSEIAWNVEGHEEIALALAAQDEVRLRKAVEAHFEYIDSAEYAEYGAQQFRDAPRVRALLAGDDLGFTEPTE